MAMSDPPPSLKYGRSIKRRREAVGYPRQTAFVAASAQAHEVLDAHGMAPLSQSTISRFEDDRTGEDLAQARPSTLQTLSFLLRWTAADFGYNVGIPIPAVPVLDDRHDPVGPLVKKLRLALGKSEEEVVKAVRRRARKFDLATYHAIEAGASELSAQPLSAREALRQALYLTPDDWESVTGLPASEGASTPAPPARIADQYTQTVGVLAAETVLDRANGRVPGEGTTRPTDLPIMPLTELWPPRLPQRGQVVKRHVLPAEQLRPGLLLTVMPDAALSPSGPQVGDLLVVDTADETLIPGQVYVVQPGNGPLVVRRAVLDAVGELWLLPDVPDFLSFAPVAPRTARILGRVASTLHPDTRQP